MLLGQPIRQICYYVPDVKTAAMEHSAIFGSGPYFLIDFPPLPIVHRGQTGTWNYSGAFGQWGEVQVEFLEQHDDSKTVLLERYPRESGEYGFHHVAIIVDDLDRAVSMFRKHDFCEAMRVTAPEHDITAVFIDTVAVYGHYVELYEPRQTLRDLYEHVRRASIGFDGHDPLQPLKF